MIQPYEEAPRRWTADTWVTLTLVAGSALFVLAHLQPSKLLLNTTPAGGDMGAHVWGPAFLRDELLPRLRLSGWTPDWYDGFPAYQFYMVVPSLMIVLVDVLLFLPYNVAFKLVSVSGLVALPVAAWAMGRLARLPFPFPAAFAVASVPFVFDRSFTIYGGNAASTLAGEFAFSISLAFALLFLGMALRGLETGRDRGIGAALLGLTALCHLIPAIFALVGAFIAFLVNLDVPRRVGSSWRTHDQRRAWWLLSTVVAGGLITSFWTVPFLLRRAYMTDMGWEKLDNVADALFPGRIGDWITNGKATTPGDLTWVIALAIIGIGTSIVFRHRVGIWLGLLAVVLAFAVDQAPQGRLWNARLLPFWYLCLYFLAAIAVVEIINAIAILAAGEAISIQRGVTLVGPVVVGVVVAVVIAFPLRTLPLGTTHADGSYSWFGFTSKDRSFIPDWARWNYSGYERKQAYPEYRDLVRTMDDVSDHQGCGRAMWEYDKDLNRFGTPMALMLLPYWTGGCIGSMEGLYFEASATTPYHFLNQAELSTAPSSAQRDLPYGDLDIALGVDHLQLLGVRYYLAFSPSAVAQADEEPDLKLVGTSGNWRIYQVAGSDLVQPLENEPAVVTGVPKGGRGWQDVAVDWYLNRSRWDVMLAADGPSSWQRVPPSGRPVEHRERAIEVTDVRVGTDSIRFHVDRPGTPVLVKASYFPNWEASNARGPYRVAPNLMVVVPTDNDVTVHYGRTSVDWLGILLTLLGIGLAVLLQRRPALDIPSPPAADEGTFDDPWLDDDDVLVGVGEHPDPPG